MEHSAPAGLLASHFALAHSVFALSLSARCGRGTRVVGDVGLSKGAEHVNQVEHAMAFGERQPGGLGVYGSHRGLLVADHAFL